MRSALGQRDRLTSWIQIVIGSARSVLRSRPAAGCRPDDSGNFQSGWRGIVPAAGWGRYQSSARGKGTKGRQT